MHIQLLFFPSDVVVELPSIYQVKSGLFKGLRKCERNGASGLLMLIANMDGGLRRIRDKGSRVESRTAFKGKLGRFKRDDIN